MPHNHREDEPGKRTNLCPKIRGTQGVERGVERDVSGHLQWAGGDDDFRSDEYTTITSSCYDSGSSRGSRGFRVLLASSTS